MSRRIAAKASQPEPKASSKTAASKDTANATAAPALASAKTVPAAVSEAAPRPASRVDVRPSGPRRNLYRHQRSDDGNAFIPDPEGGPARSSDDLAESLAEDFLQAATSGEDVTEEAMNEVVAEELGGPFVETSAMEEYATGTDESNPADAEREPLPLTSAGIVGVPPD